MSSSMAWLPNCWPPMACRPPEAITARSCRRASSRAISISSIERGFRISCTRVAFNCDCTSLTSIPSGPSPCANRGGEGSARVTAIWAEALRSSRRVGMHRPPARNGTVMSRQNSPFLTWAINRRPAQRAFRENPVQAPSGGSDFPEGKENCRVARLRAEHRTSGWSRAGRAATLGTGVPRQTYQISAGSRRTATTPVANRNSARIPEGCQNGS